MPEVRETEIERDRDGHVLGYREKVAEVPRRKSGGGMLAGMLLGVLIIAAGLVYFAYNRGSFQAAGAAADRSVSQAETQGRDVAANAAQATGDAADSAGDAAHNAAQNLN